ncbi:MAG: agmatine deiminase family protein [Bryobacterales bacterium]
MYAARLCFPKFSLFLLAAVFSLVVPCAVGQSAAQSAVQLVRIEGVREFPEATEPRAIQYACASDRAALPAFFSSRGLSFEPALVRARQGHPFCHIYYEPTVPGFRASTEDGTVSELFAAVDPVSFVVRRKPTGDSLDVIKAVLKQLPRPVDITISSPPQFEAEYWPPALEFHFPNTRHRISIVRSEAHTTHPWAQDYVKAGVANGERRILTPRRLFEGRTADGDTFRPLLDAFTDRRFARSKLSWEGGDLQFALHPRDPKKLLMFYGASARAYWGQDLDPADYEYVLRTEFGADDAVDLTRIGPHADYLAAVLPADRIALIAWPVRDDYTLAKAAIAELVKFFGRRAPSQLLLLENMFEDPKNLDPQAVLQLTTALRKMLPELPGVQDEQISAAQIAYVSKNCPGNPVACFSGEGGRMLLRNDPELWRLSADSTADQEKELSLTPILLALIESQLPGAATVDLREIAAKEKELRQLGFQVIRVPHLLAEAGDWPGVSYINYLRVGRTLFVPALGLPAVEEKIFADLRRKLPDGYEVIPIPARSSLLNNGGTHCIFGIVPQMPAASTAIE